MDSSYLIIYLFNQFCVFPGEFELGAAEVELPQLRVRSEHSQYIGIGGSNDFFGSYFQVKPCGFLISLL